MIKKKSYVATDPERLKVWREAWDLLLTDKYTLEQICQELHNRGYTRRSGKPWVIVNSRTGIKTYATSHLQRSFHLAFYAGWVVSPAHGIVRGQVRGNWEPLITDDEFDRGEAIMRQHDTNKIRSKRHIYILSGTLYMEIIDDTGTHRSKTYGSTPTGRSRSYSYYVPMRKVNGISPQIPIAVVEDQIPGILQGIGVEETALPELQALYRQHMRALKGPDLDERIKEVKARIDRLVKEETKYARLFAHDRLTDDGYDEVYREWKGKMFEAHQELAKLESGADEVIDDLDAALVLLTHASRLFERLERIDQRRLLQILFKRIIMDTQGKICDVELNSPFAYLVALSNAPKGHKNRTQPRLGSNDCQTSQPI